MSTGSARIGAFTIRREIGRGGMAVVYEALHEELGRRVAIKVLQRRDHPLAMERFRREARILARLRHPHIVSVSDLGTWEGQPYFVMDLLEGPTLAAHLAARGPLTPAEIARLFLPIASAVAAAHAGGIVHRDLKPSNVLLAERGPMRPHPTVLDFGIAKSDEDEGEENLTRDGALMGTVRYLSPEQARGARNATAKSDQYALGVMLYECATSALPFDGASSYEIMHAIVTTDARPPSARVASLDAAFDRVVLRALHRDPEQRHASVRELGRALLAFADEPTRALWRDEMGSAPPAPVAALDAPGPATTDTTYTEDRAVTIPPSSPRDRSARPAPPPRRRAASAIAGALGIAGVAVAALVASKASETAVATAVVATTSSSTATASIAPGDAPAVAPEPTGSASSLAAPPLAPSAAPPAAPSVLARPRASSSARSPAPPARPSVERGTNAVPILE